MVDEWKVCEQHPSMLLGSWTYDEYGIISHLSLDHPSALWDKLGTHHACTTVLSFFCLWFRRSECSLGFLAATFPTSPTVHPVRSALLQLYKRLIFSFHVSKVHGGYSIQNTITQTGRSKVKVCDLWWYHKRCSTATSQANQKAQGSRCSPD